MKSTFYNLDVSKMDRFNVLFFIFFGLVAFSWAQECRDHNTLCRQYARFGFCKMDQINMAKTCPKSCGYCGGGTIPTQKPKTNTPPQSTSSPTSTATTLKPSGTCGRPVNPSSRIIGGTKASKDAWPWQASIYYNGQFLCGGSVISPTWIITAAHCVDGFDYTRYQVVLGDYDRSSQDGDEQVFRANQAFHHPDWMSPSQLNNDVALIELDRPVMFNSHIQPICLPAAGMNFPVGKKCYITGWGQYYVGRAGPPTQVLKQSPLSIVSQQTCYNLNTYNLGIKVTDKMVCAGLGQQYENTGCHGDSGGPFVCQEDNGSWVLQGSVSWGSGTCDSSEAYSVFARISQFRDWIDYYVTDL